jgi:hypothetical protein
MIERVSAHHLYTGEAGEAFALLSQDPAYREVCDAVNWLKICAQFAHDYPETVVLLGCGDMRSERQVLGWLQSRPVVVAHGLETDYATQVRLATAFESVSTSASANPTHCEMTGADVTPKYILGADFEKLRVGCDFVHLPEAIEQLRKFRWVRQPYLFTLVGHTLGNQPNTSEFLKKLHGCMRIGERLIVDVAIASPEDPRLTGEWRPPTAEAEWYRAAARAHFRKSADEIYLAKVDLPDGYDLRVVGRSGNRLVVVLSRLRRSLEGWIASANLAGFRCVRSTLGRARGATVAGLLLAPTHAQVAPAGVGGIDGCH